MDDKFDESLWPNRWGTISLLLPLLFRTADGVVEVSVNSITIIPFHEFFYVPLQIFLPRREPKEIYISKIHTTQGVGAAYKIVNQPLLDMRTLPYICVVIALDHTENGSVDVADVGILIMGDPCNHKAL